MMNLDIFCEHTSGLTGGHCSGKLILVTTDIEMSLKFKLRHCLSRSIEIIFKDLANKIFG